MSQDRSEKLTILVTGTFSISSTLLRMLKLEHVVKVCPRMVVAASIGREQGGGFDIPSQSLLNDTVYAAMCDPSVLRDNSM